MNKNLIVISIIIAIIAILSWIFLLSTEKKSVPVQTVKEFSTKKTQPHQISTNKQTEASNQPISILGISPYSEQFDELDTFKKNDQLFEDFENIVSTFTNPFTPQISEVNPVSQENIDLAKVEQQIFDILYPDYFTDGLFDTQQFYIEQDFLSANYERIEKFDSEEKIFAFVNVSIDVFEEQGIYSEEDAEKFRNGVNKIWKSLLAEEKIYWQKKLISSEFYDKILTNRQYYIRKSASRRITKIFEAIKTTIAPEVYAADCYRSGGGGGVGSNVSAPCCNCGFNTDGRHVWYVEDCGGGCNLRDLGCKNLYGKGRSVIWDSSTLICGVG